MERISQSNSQSYNPADVLISVREPFNKNTFWIFPHDGIIEAKVFEKGWKVIFSTEDKGLSKLSAEQVQNLVTNLQENISLKLKKHLGKCSTDSLLLIKKQKELEEKINELEERLKKITKRQQTMLVKLKNSNGRK